MYQSVSHYERSKCRWCQAPIIWALSINGKPMPIDHEPDAERGNVVLSEPDKYQSPNATVYASKAQAPSGEVLRTSHHDTCPAVQARRARTSKITPKRTAKGCSLCKGGRVFPCPSCDNV